MGATLITSDLHPGDHDFTRVAKNGCTGLQLFREVAMPFMLSLSDQCDVTFINNGDGINAVAYLAEAMVKRSDIYADLAAFRRYNRHTRRVRFNPGNHDRRLQGCKHLWYEDEQHHLVHDCWYEHGHRLDLVWRNPGPVKSWVGEHIIKTGAQFESKVHWIDEAVCGAAGLAAKVLLPKGHKVGDEEYIRAAIALAKWDANIRRVVFGHTHRALYEVCPYTHVDADGNLVTRQVTVVNTNAWVPSPSACKYGWYGKGDVAPFMYWVERDWLLQVRPEGMALKGDCGIRHKIGRLVWTP